MNLSPQHVLCVAGMDLDQIVRQSRECGHPPAPALCPLCLDFFAYRAGEADPAHSAARDIVKPRGTSRQGVAA